MQALDVSSANHSTRNLVFAITTASLIIGAQASDMRFARPFLLLCTVLLAFASTFIVERRVARAEVPILEPNFPGGDYGLFENAQTVSEPWFMWFVLGELQSPDDVDMAQFDYKAGERFKAVIFIPAHAELRDFNPTIALIGPGLPKPTGLLPFAVPEGMGAIVATSDSTYDYFDIFTQMTYFPRAQIELAMPQTGRYYMAVWGKPIGMARYALDIGVMENFAPAVMARYPVNWWEVRGYLRWGHWPALLVPPLLTLAALWLIRRRARRKPARQYEALAGAIGFFGFAATVIAIVAQQTTNNGVQLVTPLSIVGVIALAVVGSVLWGAYFLTPVRERLNLREFAHDDHFIWVKGYAIHYSDEGPRDAPSVVLIHGFAASTFTWRNLKRALLEAGYRVIATDQLGSGASARPAEPIYTTQTQAELILGVLDALGVQQAHFVGHSSGGRVSMQIAILAPERVRSLVAISPEAWATMRPAIAKWVSIPFLGYVLAFYSTSPALVRAGLQFVSKSNHWIKNEAVKGYAAPLRVRGSALAQVWQARSPKDGIKPVPDNLSSITQPALVVWGRDDPVFPAADGDKLARTLPNAKLHMLEHVGHIAHEERAEETNHDILKFLAEVAQFSDLTQRDGHPKHVAGSIAPHSAQDAA